MWLRAGLAAGFLLAGFGAGYFVKGLPPNHPPDTERQAVRISRRTSPFLECTGEINADAGLHLGVLLESSRDDAVVVRLMAARGLTATPLSNCYAGGSGRSGLLLGFGGSTEHHLLEATRVLGQVLRA